EMVFSFAPPTNELLTVASTIKRAPKWSFAGRPSRKGIGKGAGPYCPGDAHRDINGRFARDPAWSIPSAGGRDQRPNSAPPGPGRYAPRDSSTVKQTAPSWGFGSTGRDNGWLRECDGGGPGPAAYAPKFEAVMPSAPGYSNQGGRHQNNGNSGPGPQAYPPPKSTLSKTSGRWVASSRPQSAAAARSPGPNYCFPEGMKGMGGRQYSIGLKRGFKEPIATRGGDGKLPGPRTQFGGPFGY
ncbi:unnamed protein product, partial [Polarella glacialis]